MTDGFELRDRIADLTGGEVWELVGEFEVARSTDEGNQGFTVRITQHSRLGFMVTTFDEDGEIVTVSNPTPDLDDALAAAHLQNL